MNERERLVRIWSQFLHDPIKFVEVFWPQFTLAPYQQEILRSLTVNTETWVHSANEMGKSFTAALAALWWFSTRKSKVITLSTTKDQLKGILWGEIGELLRSARFAGRPLDFGFVETELELRYPDEAGDPAPKYYLRGRVAEKVESLQGNHLPTLYDAANETEIGTVLFVVEEASGVDDVFFPAIATQRHCALFIGNPIRDQGTFAAACKAGDLRHPHAADRLFRKVIHVSGEDSPNVVMGRAWRAAGRTGSPPRRGPQGQVWHIPGILSYDTFLEREATLRPHERRTRLYGLFPEEAGQRMFPKAWLDAAQQLGAMLRERMNQRGRPVGRPFALGVDASEGGGDQSAWCVWGRFGVVEIIAKETPNTSEIAGTTRALMRRYRIKPRYVAFDAGGGGKQIADQLRERGCEEIMDVDFGAKADDPRKYMNCRAELYGELREAMRATIGDNQQLSGRIGRMLKLGAARWGNPKLWCASLPSDAAELREDLAVLPLLRDSEGRLRMLSKSKSHRPASARSEKCLRDLLGRSPDQGDAAALAYYAWRRGRQFDEAAEYDGPLVYQ